MRRSLMSQGESEYDEDEESRSPTSIGRISPASYFVVHNEVSGLRREL